GRPRGRVGEGGAGPGDLRTVAASAAAQPLQRRAELEIPPPGRKRVGRMVELVAESPDLQEPFGPTAVAEEVSRRYADHIEEPVGSRTASDVLRRMLADGL